MLPRPPNDRPYCRVPRGIRLARGGGGRTGGDGWDLDREGAWGREGGRVGEQEGGKEGRKDGERERLGLGNVWKKGSRIEG